MKVSPIKVTALEITEIPGLDPIRVFLQDFGSGRGRIIIECYGNAWSTYWGSMGTDIRSFVIAVDADYIECAMHSGRTHRQVDSRYLTRVVHAVKRALKSQEETTPITQ